MRAYFRTGTGRREPSYFRLLLIALAAVGVVCLANVPSRADTILSMEMAGGVDNGQNGPNVSINANFLWDFTLGQIVPSTLSLASSGVLGTFSFLGVTGSSGFYYFQFGDSVGDIFTENPLPGLVVPTAGVGEYSLRLFVDCANASDTCSTDGLNGSYAAQGSMSVTQVPDESPFLMLLLCEVGLFGVFRAAGWRFGRDARGRLCLSREGHSEKYRSDNGEQNCIQQIVGRRIL